MSQRNLFYAQSGGVTPVINASAAGVIQTARAHPERIGKVLAGQNGILGALREELIDTSRESRRAIDGLISTPGGAFGSCRYKLKSLAENRHEYERLISKVKHQKETYMKLAQLISSFIDDLVAREPELVQNSNERQVDIHLNLETIKETPALEFASKSQLAVALVLLN